MKKHNVIIIALLLSVYTNACDLCTFYLGINPNDFKSFISLRYQYRQFGKTYTFDANGNQLSGLRMMHNPNSSIGSNNTRYTSYERYNTYSLSTMIFLTQKWRLNLNLPFAENYVLKNDSIIDKKAGISDVQLVLKYQLYNTKTKIDSSNTLKNKIIHRLTIGSGIKFPTGKYNEQSITGFQMEYAPNTILGSPIMELDPHIQTGTGSIDYIFLMEYLLKFNSFGINSNISYRINNENPNHFRFANRINVNGYLFYLSNFSQSIRLMPFTGINYESSNRDQLNSLDYKNSGGETTFLANGLKVFVKKFATDLMYSFPIYEYLYDDQLNNMQRFTVNLTYYF